jgi:hypothetical protein
MNLQLERSLIAEVMMLLAGRDIGVRGHVASQARISGSLSRLEISGRLELSDVHRRDIQPVRGVEWPVEYRGVLDLRNERLELATEAQAKSPISVRLRAGSLLREPRWALAFTFDEMPLRPVVEVARHMGGPVLGDIALDGTLTGAVGYSEGKGLQGQVVLREALLGRDDNETVRCERADLWVSGSRLELRPAIVELGDGQRATFDGAFAPGTAELRIQTKAMALDTLASAARHILRSRSLPLLEQYAGGTWRGWLRYRLEGETEPRWSGALQIEKTRISLPELSAPLEVASATVTIDGARVRMSRLKALAGDVPIEGEYRYEPEAKRPHRFHLSVPELSGVELERLLRPLLPREPGLLARALRLQRSTTPSWLKTRQAEGRVEVAALRLGDLVIERFRANVVWNGAAFELLDAEGRIDDGVVRGWALARLGGATPEYRLRGWLHNWEWKNGRIDADFDVETSGIGRDLLANLRAEGTIEGRGLELAPDTQLRTLLGACDVRIPRGVPQVRFTALEAVVGGETYVGQGGTQADGSLEFELAAGHKPLRVAGSLMPLDLGIVIPR